MKRIILVLALVSGLSIMSFADNALDFINEITPVMQTVTSNLSTEMAKHMGFYTGDGNVTPVNTSGFLGLKFGIGVGVNTSAFLWGLLLQKTNVNDLIGSSNPNAGMFNQLVNFIGLFPMPYDNIYFKIGMPVIPLDIGIRIGFVPNLAIPLGTDFSMGLGQFHFGVEGRYLLWELPGGFIKLDARLSYDYDTGSIFLTNKQTTTVTTNGLTAGTATLTTGFGYLWSGSSIGAKVMAGLNIPVVGGVYGGLGLNVNLGGVTARIGQTGTIESTTLAAYTVTNFSSYRAIDMRLIGGFNIFVVNLAVEYNLFNGDFAINFIPFQMAF